MLKCILFSISIIFSQTIFSQTIYPGTPTVGAVEMVFDYSVSNCNTIDIPDAPTRVFRDASGNLNLMASHYTSWRMTGADFTSLTKDCTPVMNSDLDTDPSKFNNKEWISSTYTEDGTTVHALIHDEYVPCGNWNNCWYNGMTYASSTDGGQTYTHTTAPSNLVAASPYQSPYPTVHTPFGIFGGSSIIKKDGYYYVLVHLEAHLLQDWGTGVIRTDNLSDPASWRGWDGSGYTVSFVNPYTATGYSVADKVLVPVSRDRIGKMCSSLTYNTYFGKYMVVDYTVGEVNGALVYGFYYALSDDLINWSNKRLILQTTSSWAAGGSNYASIIDHNDLTRNFEQPGQTCYMYYTKWNSGTYDRDLVRVPVTFNKEIVNSFVVNVTTDGADATPGDGKCLTTGGVCSLRAALEEANSRPTYDGYDITAIPVTFNIAGTGVKTITPTTTLPEVFYPVDINGYTQTGASENTNNFDQGLNTAIKVKVDGSGGGAQTFAFHCGNNTLKGLSIVNGGVDFLYESGYSKSRNNNTIQGCFLGMSTDGLTPTDAALNFNNQNQNVIGGTTNAARNLIGGGIIMDKSSSNTVFGNYIGSTLTGIASSTTSAHGIQIIDSSSYNIIGGTNPLEPNLISGGNRGIMIQGVGTTGNEVVNNLIGSAIDGVSALGNQNAGILLSNGTSANTISGNVIMSNSFDEAGIWMDSTFSNVVISNFIGTSADQIAVAGNGNSGTFSAGIMMMNECANNTIGGVNPTEGNVIANNVFGISLYSNTGSGNSILSNILYNNSEMAIDLQADYTPLGNDVLDSDTGPNDLQNYPVITSSFVSASQISINGTFNSKANTIYTVQYYSNVSCNQSGNGEGSNLIGTQTVTTNGSGNATISAIFNVVVPVGSFITCLATDNLNNTSEFSECVVTQLASSPATPTITVGGLLVTGPINLCFGETVVLTSSTATSYLWSTGETTQSITVSSSDLYSVIAYNSEGLSTSSDVLEVNIASGLPFIDAGPDQVLCEGNDVLLSGSIAVNTSFWDNGVVDNVAFTQAVGTVTYLYTVTDLANCSNTDEVIVTVNPLPAIPIITESSNVLTSTSASSYQWFSSGSIIIGETAQNFTPTLSGAYSVEITDINGCTNVSADFNFTIVGLANVSKTALIEVSPNPSSGKFKVSFGNSGVNSMKVFNTAGAIVFNSSILVSEIDLINQPKGVYFLKIETDDKIYIKKLIVN